MFCENCGNELRQEENKLVCTKCGAIFSAESEIQAPSAEYVVPRGFSSKKNIIIIIVAAILMIGGVSAIVAVNVTNPSSQTALGGIQVAERYLSEQNYEQAIIEFEKILEIEPMNVDAYLGLADAYSGMDNDEIALQILQKGFDKTGDPRILDKVVDVYLDWAEKYIEMGNYEKALEILQKGLEETGDSRIQVKIDELNKPVESEVSSSSSSSSSSSTSSSTSSSETAYGSMGFVTIEGMELDIATTTRLELRGHGLTSADLEPLAKLVNLTDLDLSNNKIIDLTPLAGLTNLKNLNLYINQISDVSPLVSLTNLEYLKLENNRVSDITPLAELKNLKYVDLGRYDETYGKWLQEQLPNCEVEWW